MPAKKKTQSMISEIRQQMADQGCTVSQLAERSGVNREQLSGYLAGRRDPGLTQLARIARGLGCHWTLTPDDA